MKLKNKLLPLVGVATACAAVAPIALTSCKSNSNDWIDLMTKYNPTVKALDNTTLTTEKANEAYFGNEKDGWVKDEDIIARFKDDFLWSLYNEDTEKEYTEAKVKFSDFYVNHVTYTPSVTSGEEAHKITTFTFKCEFSGSYTYTDEDITTTISYNVVNTATNLPFAVWFNTNADTWFVTPDVETIADNDISAAAIAWSVSGKTEYTATISSQKYGFETTNTNTREANCYVNCYEGNIAGYKYFFSGRNNYSEANVLDVVMGGKSHYMLSVQNGD